MLRKFGGAIYATTVLEDDSSVVLQEIAIADICIYS